MSDARNTVIIAIFRASPIYQLHRPYTSCITHIPVSYAVMATYLKFVRYIYSKTCVKWPLSKRPKIDFKTNHRLMQVKNIAECSKGSFLQYFRPSLSYHLSLRSLFCLFLSGRLTQVLFTVSDMRNPVFGLCEKEMCRPAWVCTQSDQRVCFSLYRKMESSVS